MIHKILFVLGIIFLFSASVSAQNQPLKIGVIGLTHSHVHWILGREDRDDIKMVGIVESNRDLAERYSKHMPF